MTCRDVVGPGAGALDYLAQERQTLIAGRVPVDLVVASEIVDVEHDRARRQVRPQAASPGAVRRAVEAAAIGQARHPVGEDGGLRFDLALPLIGVDAIEVIAERGDQDFRISFLFAQGIQELLQPDFDPDPFGDFSRQPAIGA